MKKNRAKEPDFGVSIFLHILTSQIIYRLINPLFSRNKILEYLMQLIPLTKYHKPNSNNGHPHDWIGETNLLENKSRDHEVYKGPERAYR